MLKESFSFYFMFFGLFNGIHEIICEFVIEEKSGKVLGCFKARKIAHFKGEKL